MGFSREERIKQLQACAAGISEEAEKIIGDFKYNQGLKVTIDIQCREYPIVTVERTFTPEKFVEYLSKGVVPMP